MINLNGILQSTENALSVRNRGFLYGDGIYDVLKYVNGKIYFWEEHYLRLMASMRIARMEIPDNFTMEFIEKEIIKTISENSYQDKSVIVRLTITRNGENTYTPTSNTISYCIDLDLVTNPFYQIKDVDYEIELYKDFYIQPDLLSNLKTTNKIINVIGSVFSQENDYQNCLLLNSQKNVVGFLDGNIFIVNGNNIKTPPLSDGCINGIIRKKIIEIITKLDDFTIEEASISPFDLQKSDEIFLTNSIVGIQSITKYRKKMFENKIANNLVGKLNTLARLG